MSDQQPLIDLLIALGDDELVLGHRHSEWTGFAPHIEEDVAFSSIAQDEIGHAAAYYAIVGGITGQQPDAIALGRDKHEYRNAQLCERKNSDWAYTLARQWIYDNADAVRLEALRETSHADLRALVTKIQREERWHLLHADMWLKRISQGPIEGRTKLIEALSDAFADSMGLFEPLESEQEAVDGGWLTVPSQELRKTFVERAGQTLDDAGLPTHVRSRLDQSAEFVASSSGDLIVSDDEPHEREQPTGLGGRRGRHSGDFDQLWDDLTYTYRENPGARW